MLALVKTRNQLTGCYFHLYPRLKHHLHTMEGFWSLLRSWLRPHRGISQEKRPLYLGFFEFVHNVRKRGQALLGALIELLVT